MPQQSQKSREQIINEICQSLKKKVKVSGVEVLLSFARIFYDTLSLEDLLSRSIDDLSGSMMTLWEHINQYKAKATDLRIYNPDYTRDGWSSKHSVIALCQEDMPFLVDSMMMEFERLGISVHFIVNVGNLHFTRDTKRQVTKVLSQNLTAELPAEAVVYFEVDRIEDPKALKSLKENLMRVLHDVALAVSGWSSMVSKVEKSVEDLKQIAPTFDQDELHESLDFLQWLLNKNFIFLGCRDYRFSQSDKKDGTIDAVANSGCGVLAEKSSSALTKHLANLPVRAREVLLSRQILVVAKTNTISTVHRPTYTDYIGIKQFDAKGKVVGFRLLIGLYTSAAYNSDPRHIPFLRKKIEHILKLSKLSMVDHSGKALLNILETLPRDDLFQANKEELFDLSMGILHLKERQRTRLFVRKDTYNRYFSCLVYLPKDRVSTELRLKLQGILVQELHGFESSFNTIFTESVLARIHFLIRVDPAMPHDYDYAAIEQKIIAASHSWVDSLKENLETQYGAVQGMLHFNKYRYAFSSGYREEYEARAALVDIEHVEKLNDTHQLEMAFYKTQDTVHLKLYRANAPSPLSDVLPILENMGFRVMGESPHVVHFEENKVVWINDFQVVSSNGAEIHVEEIREVFQDAFPRVWFGEAESDRFNRLILAAQLSWKETALLRAYARYLKQIGFTFSQDYIADTLSHNPSLSKTLIALFKARFDPSFKGKRDEEAVALQARMDEDLNSVSSLDEDRILRRYLALVMATLRTNYFQSLEQDMRTSCISIKLSPDNIPEMPLPKPLYEIFIYSPRVEGVHLRGAKVARGGIRWSDRREDFRTEILGLMKAQQVKNAVIVPLGAKGGFVPKLLPTDDRESMMREAIACYQIFIKGLLCITDNIIEGKIIHPEKVVRYDEEDPYLVVAADKGTATFSDIANAISLEYKFWLGDAFASGGSAGYDHKKMGITAKGAWESAKRHFLELSNKDIQTTPFTVLGVGDMSGDVFGNGMLLSRHTCLVAAFNHMHIFVDPNPDPEKSFIERERLFQLPRSTWDDYDRKAMSKGSAIFKRSEKSLKLSPEIQKLIGLEQAEMTPNELIKALFRANIDMFWNGGIGTFVKAESETDIMVGDRANDAIRVNAHELGCKVVVEGGNLGFTQKARIEYSRRGGRINTDFIDNSAGVDCSDHEVNLKILLNQVMANGDLTLKQRNKLLADMTDEVAELVLRDNYLQTETLSLETYTATQTVDLLHRYLLGLEKKGKINRKVEGLPSDEEILERKIAGQGFSRPEIAVLLAYDKIILKQQILASDLPEDPYFFEMLAMAFPKRISKKYPKELLQHSLHRELIATQLSNHIGNAMGINFVQRLKIETGASTDFIVRAYLASHHLLDVPRLWEKIRALDCQVDTKLRFDMMLKIYYLVRRSTRWFLRNCSNDFNITKVIETFEKPLKELKTKIPSLLAENDKNSFKQNVQRLRQQSLPEDLAKDISLIPYMFNILDVVKAAQDSKRSVLDLAEIYVELGKTLDLNILRSKMMLHKIEGQWDELARASLLDDIDYYQRILALDVLSHRRGSENISAAVMRWMQEHAAEFERWSNFLIDLLANPNAGFVMFAVLGRELQGLTRSCSV